MIGDFDKSIEAFKDSSEYLNGVIEAEKRKQPNDKSEALVSDLEEMRQEIATKIAEVQEAKEQVRSTTWSDRSSLSKTVIVCKTCSSHSTKSRKLWQSYFHCRHRSAEKAAAGHRNRLQEAQRHLHHWNQGKPMTSAT